MDTGRSAVEDGSYIPPQLQSNETEHDQDCHPPLSPLHPFEISGPSPSAQVAAECKRNNNYHRWPSFSLETAPNAKGHIPINILNLPWQHPFRNHESNRNPYKLPRVLFAALCLTTLLALCSAWDAQIHCLSNETDALTLLGEESEGNDVEGDEEMQDGLSGEDTPQAIDACKMYRHVMLPVGLVVGFGSLLALGILRQHQKSFGKTKPLMVQSPPCFYSFYLPLLFVSSLILATWTVAIMLVMLRPRKWQSNDNQYASLAAVDSMGQVAQNANLYYLSWISEGMAILIFYHLFGAFIRLHWHPLITTSTIPANPSTLSATSSAFPPWQKPSLGLSLFSAKQFMVHSPTKPIPATAYHSSRIKWFQTFYQLRVRTGIWVAAMLSSLVLLFASSHICHEVLLPAAQSIFDDDDYLADQGTRNDWWGAIVGPHKKVCVILAYHDSNLSEEMCSRTFFSTLTGFVAVTLSSTAIILHLLTRRSAAADALYYEACGGVNHELALQMMATKHHRLPLGSELLLSVVLSLWLGWNALMVSSVEGPASRVGNLYYSSWLSFLLCLRICLGCIEEYFNIKSEDLEQQNKSYRAQELTPDPQSEPKKNLQAPPASNDKVKKERGMERGRAGRVRRYFFLGIFSSVCGGSAYDAAMNQDFVLTLAEKYMILAPAIVAVLSAVLFSLCLSKVYYGIVSQPWCGGLLSVLIFGIWLVNLVLTMHSEDSWAVNAVGEIKNGNLYYFSWASIIMAGLQMTSYAKELLDIGSEEDFMVVAWAAIYKICFIILGAAGHVWHSIGERCEIALSQTSAITFCSRTILAMIVSGTGIFIGGSVLCVRLFVPTRFISTKSRNHCEAVISIFLFLLFGTCCAMITSIGSPGQSAGDLYYSVWLAFSVSLGIFQRKMEEMASEEI